MATLKVTKGNANTLLRRGTISAGIYKRVQEGATVSIEYQGNLFSSFRPQSMTVDGQTMAFGKGHEPERQRRSMTPRRKEGVPSKVTTGTPTDRIYPSDLPKPKPSFEREQFISTRDTATMSQADIKSFTTPSYPAPPRGGLAGTDELTAKEIFGVAREKGLTTEELIGGGPVFRGREINENIIYTPVGGRGEGFAPSPKSQESARREFERDIGLYGRQEDIRPVGELFKEKPISIKETVKAVGISFIAPTKKKVEKSRTSILKYESESITPTLTKLFGTESGIRKREMITRQYEQITKGGVDKKGKFIIPGGKQKFMKDVLGIGIGAREILARPVTKVAPEIVLGIVTGGAFRGAGLVLEKAPLSVIQRLASPTGQAIRKGARGAAFGTFAGIEAHSISKSEDAFKRLGQAPIRLLAFGVGEAASSKILTPKIRRRTGTPYAELTRQEQLQMTIAPQGKKFFEPFIKLQRKVSSAERKGLLKIESEALTPETLPKVIPKEARKGTIKVIKEQDLLIFGSQSPKLKFGKRFEIVRSRIAGEPKPVGDLDAAIGEIKISAAGESLVATVKPTTPKLEVKAQSIGVKGGEKFFDIKPEERLEGFEFIGPIKKTMEVEPVRTTSISEELARKIAGGIEFRREGKDIPDILAISRLLVEKPKTAELIGVSPKLRRTILKKTQAGAGKPENIYKALGITKDKRKGFGFDISKSSKIPRARKAKAPLISSQIPASKLPSTSKINSFISSAIPVSKIPKSSKIPASKLPSILKVSTLPYKSGLTPTSKIPKSKTPSSIFSQMPPSKIPKSLLPSRRTSRLSNIPYMFQTPPPTRLRPPKFKFIGFEERVEKPRELKRWFKYKPSIFAVGEGVKGKKPEVITGLEVRPLT